MFQLFLYTVGTFFILITLPGNIELLLLTVSALLPNSICLNKKKELSSKKPGNVAVLVPAHNEEKNIERTIQSLKNCKDIFDIIVIADNCSDQTATVSQKCGARVLIRKNPEKRGKPHALNYAFSFLDKENYDLYIIIDADTVVQENFIRVIRQMYENGAQVIQTRYDVLNPDISLRTRLMNVAFLAINYLRPKGRQNLGFSSGLLGNGMAISKKTIMEVPYNVDSIVEDIVYHIRLVAANKKVHFTEKTRIFSEIPFKGKGVITQRARWEGGRLHTLVTEGPKMLKDILSGRFRLIGPLLDLLLMPLSFHVLLLSILLLFPSFIIKAYALTTLIIVAFHIITALKISGGKARERFTPEQAELMGKNRQVFKDKWRGTKWENIL